MIQGLGKVEVDSKEWRMKKCLPGQTLLSQGDKNKTVICIERNKPNKKKEKNRDGDKIML